MQLDLFAITNHPLFQEIEPHVVEGFWKFHQENPEVFGLFKALCDDVRNAGKTKYGAKAVMEVVRWKVNVYTHGDEFKINNNYTSCYARLLMIEDPSFDGFFQLRSSNAEVA